MSLVEVLIASAILAVITLAMFATLVLSTRISREAQRQLIALEVINRQAELIRGAPNYFRLGVVDTDTGGWGDTIEGFVHPDFVRSDPDNPDVTTTFRVRYEWSGFGLVRSADSNSFEAEIFRNQPYELDWGIMDFTGHRVLLRDGQGAGQMANITDMDITVSGGVITSVSFDIDCAFNGYSVSSWGLIPGLNAATNERTYFEIDGGKTCRITAEWLLDPDLDPTDSDNWTEENIASIQRTIFVPFPLNIPTGRMWPLYN